MAQLFDVPAPDATGDPVARAAESAEPGPGYAAPPRPLTRVLPALRRLPLLSLLATTLVVDLAALALRAEVAATLGVLTLVWLRVPAARRRSGPGVADQATATARALVTGVAVLVVVLHLALRSAAVLDDVLALGAVAVVTSACAAALAARRARPPRVLVVGDLPRVRGLVAGWIDDGSVRVAGGLVLGTSADHAEAGLHDLGIACIGSLADVVDHVDALGVDLVLVAPGPAVTPDDLRRLGWAMQAARTRLAVVSATEDVAPHRIGVATVGGATVGLVEAPGHRTAYAVAKVVLDRVLGLVLALLALPVVLVAAAAVRLDSRGPAFFHQTRIGRDGEPFTMLKLRTMTTSAEDLRTELVELDEGNGVLFKIRRDPRVTRVGGVLRRTSIDELPQLLNVVRGEMSLVGPRPALPEEVECYSDAERRRLAVKPGLTGLWQVSGRSLLSRERSMRLDTAYVDNGRAATDASILVRTVAAVVSRRGAF